MLCVVEIGPIADQSSVTQRTDGKPFVGAYLRRYRVSLELPTRLPYFFEGGKHHVFCANKADCGKIAPFNPVGKHVQAMCTRSTRNGQRVPILFVVVALLRSARFTKSTGKDERRSYGHA